MRSGIRVGGVAAGALAVLALSAGSGCSIGLAAQLVPSNGDGGAGSGTPDRGSVRVVFRNRTAAEAVEVEFYAADVPLDVVPDDLFDPANGFLVVRNIGVGGRGVIGPGETDSIKIDCGEELVLGTLGGLFLDNETGDELGTGTMRWVREDAQFSCGASVVLEYTSDGDSFQTNLLLGAGDS